MERIVHKARSYEEAARWDRHQHRAMSPDERRAVLGHLKLRAFGTNQVDVRASGEAKLLRPGADE